jgi:hypothetical protein
MTKRLPANSLLYCTRPLGTPTRSVSERVKPLPRLHSNMGCLISDRAKYSVTLPIDWGKGELAPRVLSAPNAESVHGGLLAKEPAAFSPYPLGGLLHLIFSNSTSKWRKAFGGITGGTPRSP